jgi:hypothetical protein
VESSWVHSAWWPLIGLLYLLGWLWWWRIWWNEDWQGKPKYLEKTRPSATLSTTNPTWPDLGSNPGSCGGKPATNRLIYGVAYILSNHLVFSLLRPVTDITYWIIPPFHVVPYFVFSLVAIPKPFFLKPVHVFFPISSILSQVWVITDGVWIGNWIYWTLTDHNYSVITNSHTLSSSLQHVLSLLSLLCLHQLVPGSGFQHRTIPVPQLSDSNSNTSQLLQFST